MLRLIFRKMLNNKWMVICLIIGCTFAIAVAAAIPMYTSGLYNVLLSNEFKNEQDKFGTFPFKAYLNTTFYGLNNEKSKTVFNDLDSKFYDEYIGNMPVERVFDYKAAATKAYSVFDARNYKVKQGMIDRGEQLFARNLSEKANFSISSSANAPNMLDVVGGRMFQSETEDGVIEAVITPYAAALYRLSIGETYYIYNKITDSDYITKIQVVGIVEINDESSSFFTLSDRTFLIDFNHMQNMIYNSEISLQSANWFAAFDYTTVSVGNIDRIIEATNTLSAYDSSNITLSSTNNYITILNKYNDDIFIMQKLFLLLVVPVILMIGMYVVMISQLMMEREKSEIATFESRGASRNQIFMIYFGQGIVLSVISFVLGMILAKSMCRLLGAANGFMEFVNRTAIEVKFNQMSIIYAVICAVAYLIMILVPAYKASKYSIVQHKQNISNNSKKSFWQVIFLDFILIGISLYFLYNYESMSEYIQKIQSTSVDFTLFIAVTLFVLGFGLLFIRLFPYLVKFIFLIAKRRWKPAAYTAFTHVARGGNYKQFIMIFLILTISIGIFNANAGRTLNENLEDNIRHPIGADISFVPAISVYNPDSGNFEFQDCTGSEIRSKADKYCDTELVNNYCVYYFFNSALKPSDESVTFMGIEPYEFGQVVNMRKDLNGGLHINHILNTLSTYPEGVIISRKVADLYEVQTGQYFDYIYSTVTANGTEEILVENTLVVAVVDYWPSIAKENFIVMTQDNYNIMKNFTYRGRVLVDKKDGVLDSEILEDMRERMSEDETLGTNAFVDYEVTNAKKNSILNGMNGILTLDFLISMIICCVGFIIFWIISVRQRVLQFGIFRAMGMKKNELYRMIFYEQFMISFVSIFIGILIGGIASQVFAPFFERISTLGYQNVPFSTYQDGIDYLRIYIITGLSLIIGLSVLLRFISKLKIDQALKLGED